MPTTDMEKFRLRHFVEKLDEMGEVETHAEPVALADLSQHIEGSSKAVLFKNAGPQNMQVVAGVSGSRKRLAAAFGVKADQVVDEYRKRIRNRQPVVEVSNAEAPVQRVVIQGDDIDITRLLPFHVQHQFDGSAYISSAIDYSVDPETGLTNVGMRRLSLRGKRECGTNVTANSDLKRIYKGRVARGEKHPISFAIGAHPLDQMAACMRIPNTDEVTLVGTLRGEPVPLVKSLTNDIRVPADAEMILEGYLDERGYIEPEGPYGEYVGFYGPIHLDPIFHITAITMRDDMLHQSLLHGAGPVIHRAESVHMGAIAKEAHARNILEAAGIRASQIHVPPSSSEGQHIRVAIKPGRPGLARNVIALLVGGVLAVKHVFVTDDDIDVSDDGQFEWAFASRFQADRDLVLFTGILGMPMDPSLDGGNMGAKAGFDLTLPYGKSHQVTMKPASAPVIEGPARYQTVRQALEGTGPLYYADIMAAIGTRDGREVAAQLDDIRAEGKLARNANGQYLIGTAKPGFTQLTEPIHDPNSFLH
jgi:UbiD family decarboxylase